MPFFGRLFVELGAREVVDIGAGSARLSIEFAMLGLAVDAIDPDASMLTAAETNIASAAERISECGGTVRLQRGGFGDLASLGITGVDAIVCTGNALPHVAGATGLRVALADFAEALRPGGALVLHLLNHDRLFANRPRTLSPMVRDTEDGTRIFLRVLDYAPDDSAFDISFLTLRRGVTDPAEEGVWSVSGHAGHHTALPSAMLANELSAAGFERFELLGGHDGHGLTDADESLIVVARRV
jgi:SAM-dependent methyltransferase